MNALTRFFSLGMQDADRRLAAALEPPPFEAADRYLKDSRIVSAFDRATRRLSDCWSGSVAGGAARSASEVLTSEPRLARYQAVGAILLTAVLVHVLLTLMNGPRPGWYWMLVPGLAAIFAVLLLAGSRSPHPAD